MSKSAEAYKQAYTRLRACQEALAKAEKDVDEQLAHADRMWNQLTTEQERDECRAFVSRQR